MIDTSQGHFIENCNLLMPKVTSPEFGPNIQPVFVGRSERECYDWAEVNSFQIISRRERRTFRMTVRM